MGPLDIILQPVLEENIRSWKSQKLIQVHDLFSCALTRQVNDGIKIPFLYSQARIKTIIETVTENSKMVKMDIFSDPGKGISASGETAESLVRVSLHRLHGTLILESQITVKQIYSRNPW